MLAKRKSILKPSVIVDFVAPAPSVAETFRPSDKLVNVWAFLRADNLSKQIRCSLVVIKLSRLVMK